VAWYRIAQVEKMLGHPAEQRKALDEFQRLRDLRIARPSVISKDISAPDEVTKQQVDSNVQQ
jgi:hypothetical protein